MAEQRTAAALRESEATLRAFFETDGLFASIIERQGNAIRYVAANTAFVELCGRNGIVGEEEASNRDRNSFDAALADRLRLLPTNSPPVSVEQAVETEAGQRWFAITISPVARTEPTTPRYATAALEITERKRAEVHQRLLMEELNHRVKNVLAVVSSLAQQSFRGDLASADAKRSFEARLGAVASAHDSLVRQEWKSASMRDLAIRVAGPGCGADPKRIDIEGAAFDLPPHTAVTISLALHELCTNAVKYGALSNDSGRVSVRWSIANGVSRSLHIVWTESGGPQVTAPSTRGFGSRLIERALAAELGGPVRMDFRPEGLVCTITAPLSRFGA